MTIEELMGSRSKPKRKYEHRVAGHNDQLFWTGLVGLTILVLLLSRLQNPQVPSTLVTGEMERNLAGQISKVKGP